MRHCQLHVLPQYDDWVDTVTQAMSWISTTHPLEFKDEDEEPVPERGSAFNVWMSLSLGAQFYFFLFYQFLIVITNAHAIMTMA